MFKLDSDLFMKLFALLVSQTNRDRKDRVADCHGGAILNVKEMSFFKRRGDLEIRGLKIYGSN